MSHAILILGESGTGKSSSIRTLDSKETFIINVNDRKLPFKNKGNYILADNGDGNYLITDQSQKIISALRYIDSKRPDIKNIILDDFSYTFINNFMRRAKEKSFDKFTDIGSEAWMVFQTIKSLRDDLFIFVMMHTEIDNQGRYKPKTVGKLMDSNNIIEGTFDYVFHSMILDDQFMFLTKNDGTHMAHTLMDMFEDKYINNDLLLIKQTIQSYNEEEE